MKENPANFIRPFASSLYLVAALVVVLPMIDLVLTFWPFAPGSAEWRYGAVGLLSGFVLTPLMGMTLAVVIVHSIQSAAGIKVTSILNIAAGGVIGVATLMFILDALQVRGNVPLEGRGTFDIGMVKAILKNGTSALAFLWMGIVGMRAPRAGGSSEGGKPPIVLKHGS